MKWLILPVEVKHREFLSRLLLARLAVERGYAVLIGRDTAIRRLAPALPRGILFDKSLGTARHGKPQRWQRLGYKTVVMDEESTGFYGSPEQFLKVRLADDTLNACTRWYCISNTIRDAAAKLYPDHADRFEVTGLIRTDVWRKPFLSLYREHADKIKQETGRFILFNSNFGSVIHARGAAFVQKQVRGQKQAFNAVENRTRHIINQANTNLDAYLTFLPRVAEKFPNHTLVVRPHPSENIDFWREKLGSFSNITISNEGVATPWILASDVLLHHGCTTGIEAALLGKPHIMYAPHPDDHHETKVMAAFAAIERDGEAVLEHIANTLDGQDLPHGSVGQREQFFANLDGRMVAQIILDDLDKFAFEGGELSSTLAIMRFHPRLLAASLKHRSSREKAYALQKWPGTNTAEIEKTLAIIAKALGTTDNVNVQEVFNEVFQITP